MSKRIHKGLLVLGSVMIGWIAGQITMDGAWAQTTAASAPSASRYELRSGFIGDTWETMRLDRTSGEVWHEVDNKLLKLKDAKPLAAGDYDLVMITNGKVYLAHRIDRKSGKVWRISGTDWIELPQAN